MPTLPCEIAMHILSFVPECGRVLSKKLYEEFTKDKHMPCLVDLGWVISHKRISGGYGLVKQPIEVRCRSQSLQSTK